jgi:hydrogenase-4 component F
VSFGVPVALIGVLLHVLAHAAAKGNAFMGAGVLVRKFAIKHVSGVGGGLDLLPWTGPLLLATVLALSAMPPFGLFRSEFLIVAGGFSGSHDAAAAILIVLVTLAFLGLAATTNGMLLGPAPGRPGAAPAIRGEPSAWMVIPIVAGMVVLLVLGLHPPAHLTELLARGAAELRGTT